MRGVQWWLMTTVGCGYIVCDVCVCVYCVWCACVWSLLMAAVAKIYKSESQSV